MKSTVSHQVTAMNNEALWLDGPGREPRVGTAELYEPGEDELLVKVNKP